jgi:tRNA(fMet)-specific endonuclease VapC
LRFERLAFDSNAAIDFLRPNRPLPHPLAEARTLVMPLFVLAELTYGASRSRMPQRDRRDLEGFKKICEVLAPDEYTCEHYAVVRAEFEARGDLPRRLARVEGLRNDLWIAALCLQHELPFLSNDRDFDGIEALEVIHW